MKSGLKFVMTEGTKKLFAHPVLVQIFSFFLSHFLSFIPSSLVAARNISENIPSQRKMISPMSLMSVRFKPRVICRILFLIFTTRLITAPGRMSAVLTLQHPCVSLFLFVSPMLDQLFNDPYRIFHSFSRAFPLSFSTERTRLLFYPLLKRTRSFSIDYDSADFKDEI